MNPCPTSQRIRTLQRGIDRASRLLDGGRQQSLLLSRCRLVFVLIGMLVCGGLYREELYVLGNWVLAAFAAVFVGIAQYHTRLESRLSRLKIWQHIKESHLARTRLHWEGIPDYEGLPLDQHPYAHDLDVIGIHSLFRLVDTTLSTEGHHRLGSWFLEPDASSHSREEWEERQALIRELSPLSGLRDRMSLVAKLINPRRVNGNRIRQLLEQPVGGPHLHILVGVTSGLAIINLVLFFYWAIVGGSGYWILSWLVYVFVLLLMSGRVSHLFEHVLDLQLELEKLGSLLGLLETRKSPALPGFRRMCQPLHLEAANPSRALFGLGRVCHGLSVKAHPLIHLGLNAVGPWDLFWALRLDCHIVRLRPVLPVWLDCLSLYDAASALATFAYLHPAYVWPKLLPDGDARNPHLHATALGHPLLPEQQRVSNDFEISGLGQIRLVTGSNMSGKSTFLRTVGLNVCLAQAGGPVCAKHFEWTWCRIQSCIRVGDSLEEGLSFFYAEVKRLKRLLDSTKQQEGVPVLFLIDEIFKGTNNRERLLGSQAFIRELSQGYGFGLVTTHDLELACLEDEVPGIVNIHFQETVGDHELKFDYHLKPGPCPTTNALRIMKMEGLPIPDERLSL